jgi:hypothetical protein
LISALIEIKSDRCRIQKSLPGVKMGRTRSECPHLAPAAVRGDAAISPLLANIYLHYVLDLWAERWRRREASGDMIIVRYADDFIVGFEHESDARRFWNEMPPSIELNQLWGRNQKDRKRRLPHEIGLRWQATQANNQSW